MNRLARAIAIATTAAAAPAVAQNGGPAAAESVIVTPGAAYQAGGLHRFFFGDHWRDLWTAPVRVEVLDLGTFAGGLRPVKKGGGKQTRSLRFKGADGRDYAFRTLDKDPSPLLPASLRHSLAQDIVQDQISAGHPGAPLVVSPLLAAAGVLHAEPRLVVLPDDERLGEFRAEFAGRLGTIEERPRGGDDEGPGFEQATKVVDTYELFRRLEKDRDESVDARAYLAARLMDLFLGDWDRHQDQWSWARLGAGDEVPWTPIPRDRDQAFARFDGALLGLARLSYPQLVAFSDHYPSMVGLTWNARVVDRRLLTGLERPVWDSTAAALQARLTDAVIDSAVERLPDEMRRRNGAWLAAALKRRRDALGDAAGRFYRMLAGEVEVHGSDKAERVEIAAAEPGTVDLAIYAANAPAGEPPRFHRRFDRRETREVRLYLHGGDDAVRITGEAGGGPLVRVIGGGGDDQVIDSSRAARVRLYDARGTTTTGGLRRVPLDPRPYHDFQPSDSTPYPPRDWGGFWRFQPWITSGPEVGLFLGGGITRYNFGFRTRPWSSRITVRAGYATGADALRAELAATFLRVNSRVRYDLFARASGIDVVRFYGLGNETPRLGDDSFYRIPQRQYHLRPSITFPVAGDGELTLGPVLKHVDTDLDPGRFITTAQPYGVGSFTEAGAAAGLAWDTRDHPSAATRGVRAEAAGSVYPAVLDVDGTFGEVHGTVSTYLTPRGGFAPTLALRAGAKKVWGSYPYFESAFLGGASTVRGLREDRYAGDAAVYGNAELRLPLARVTLVLPGEFGVFGLGDVGRVYLEGESSDTWHTGVGGGVWFAFLDQANTLTAAIARGDDRTAFYFRAGFAY